MIILRPKINVDKRGKITTGTKAVSEKTGKEYPKATDYFNIEDFPELQRSYGMKPNKLVLFFPDNEIESFFTADYVLYGSNQTLIRKCDGNECIHRIDEEVAGIKYVAGEISECVCTSLDEDDKKRCKIAMYLKAFIADRNTGKIENPLCYLFYSGSRNTAENLYSELIKIRNLLGGKLVGIPFGLQVDMVSGRTDAKQKFPIWSLRALGSISQLKLAIESYLFDYKEILKLGQGTANEEKIEETKVLTEEDEIRQRQDPKYWVQQIEKIKTYNELIEFEKTHHLEISMFGGEDEEVIKKTLESKKKQVMGY